MQINEDIPYRILTESMEGFIGSMKNSIYGYLLAQVTLRP
jgi:hypothetical protein